MGWRVCDSLQTLLDQVNRLAPQRDKSADGGIGDAKHASRDSDHNPWFTERGVGVVTARDFTNDAAHGMDSHRLALALVETRDSRIKYVIDHGRICAGDAGPSPWVWREYNGENKHDHHVHVSVKGGPENKRFYDDARPWNIRMDATPSAPTTVPSVPRHPTLKVGSVGEDVKDLQRRLGFTSKDVDGDFGDATKRAVVAYQTKNHLVVDGKVGPYTWQVLTKGE